MMNYTVVLSVDALEDLREIALYIQSYAPEKAAPFVHDIIDYFEDTLSQFPMSGVMYLKVIRKLTYKKHTAFYVVNEAESVVEILHIVDLAKPLAERGVEFGE